jgi:hypothetical protein
MAIRPGVIEKFKKWSTCLSDACKLYGLLNFMKVKVFRVNFNFLICLVLLASHSWQATAQKIQYCRENVFITNPDNLQLVANIAGSHHLLSFNKHERPQIFIYNDALELVAKPRFPFSIPDKSEVRVIPFADFYYLYLRTRFTHEYFLWKIDANGNFTNFTNPFRKLVASQAHNIKLGFQLIESGKHLWMVYHTDLDNPEKNTIVITQADSLLNVIFSHKVQYAFKRDEEKLHQEILLFGRNLLVLKTARSGTSLELMKINLATGYSISNTFASSGYFYSQSSFHYNNADSSITVSSLLTEPRYSESAKRFIFISRLNKILAEVEPFGILKSQFVKNTGTNFLLVDGYSKWMRLRAEWGSFNDMNDNTITVYQDFTMPGSNTQSITDNNRLLARVGSSRSPGGSSDPRQGIRFSVLDRKFTLVGDTLLSNIKDFYTVKADNYLNFEAGEKEYLIVAQSFAKRNKGLLMVNSNESQQLVFREIRVNDRNNYLLGKSQLIFKKGIIIPYTRKQEAGLVKITVE